MYSYPDKKGIISIQFEKINAAYVLIIKDNGIGIPEDEKDKIFARFYRADNAIHTETDGSGLGLFIALSVVKRHGGTIWFNSVINQGSTFHLVLPLHA